MSRQKSMNRKISKKNKTRRRSAMHETLFTSLNKSVSNYEESESEMSEDLEYDDESD